MGGGDEAINVSVVEMSPITSLTALLWFFSYCLSDPFVSFFTLHLVDHGRQIEAGFDTVEPKWISCLFLHLNQRNGQCLRQEY